MQARWGMKGTSLRVCVLATGKAGKEALSIARHELRCQLDDVQVQRCNAFRKHKGVLLLFNQQVVQCKPGPSALCRLRRTFSGSSNTTGLK